MKTDKELKNALVAQLNFWLGRNAENIQVTVEDGIVTLRGCVPHYEEKLESVETVQRAGGVRAVKDEIVVVLPETRKRADTEIAAAAANAIGWLTTIPQNSINITAQAGRLILEGTTEDGLQKGAVEYAVRHLPGITEITNLITIKPRPLHLDAKTEQKQLSAAATGCRHCKCSIKETTRIRGACENHN